MWTPVVSPLNGHRAPTFTAHHVPLSPSSRLPTRAGFSAPHWTFFPNHLPTPQGKLKGFDVRANVIMADCVEREFSAEDGVEMVPLGLYMIKGDNVYVPRDARYVGAARWHGRDVESVHSCADRQVSLQRINRRTRLGQGRHDRLFANTRRAARSDTSLSGATRKKCTTSQKQ